MQFSELVKWNKIIENYHSLIKNSSSDEVFEVVLSNKDNASRFNSLLSSVESEYITILHKCTREIGIASIQEIVTTYQELPRMISNTIPLFSFLSRECIDAVIQLLFHYEARLDSFLTSPSLTHPLEIEFVQRGLEWSLRTLDELITGCTQQSSFQLSETSNSTEAYFWNQAIQSIRTPSTSFPFHDHYSNPIADLVHQHLHSLRHAFHDFHIDHMKETLITIYASFEQLDLEDCFIVVSMLESMMLEQFTSSTGVEIEVLLKLICSMSPRIVSWQIRPLFSTHKSDLPIIAKEMDSYFQQPIQPIGLYKYRKISAFLSRRLDLELQVLEALFKEKEVDVGLCKILLCLWGVTPSMDYLRSLRTMLLVIQDMYQNTLFYDLAFSVTRTEGVSAFHYYSMIVYLYLMDTRSLSIDSITLKLDMEYVHILRTLLACMEIRRELILSAIPSLNELTFTCRIKRMDSLLERSAHYNCFL